MLTIDETSWHATLAWKSSACELFTDHWKREAAKANLCPYVRHVLKVLFVLFLVGWIGSTIPFLVHEAFTTTWFGAFSEGSMSGANPLFAIWYSGGTLAMGAFFAILTLGMVFGSIGGTVEGTKYLAEKVRGTVEPGTVTTWDLVKAWFQAKHDKMCPTIEFVNTK